MIRLASIVAALLVVGCATARRADLEGRIVRIKPATYGAGVDKKLVRRLKVNFEISLLDQLRHHGGVTVLSEGDSGNADYTLEVRVVDAEFTLDTKPTESGDRAIEFRLAMRGVAMLTSRSDPDEIFLCPIPVPGASLDPSVDYLSSDDRSLGWSRQEELLRIDAEMVALGILTTLELVTVDSFQWGVPFPTRKE